VNATALRTVCTTAILCGSPLLGCESHAVDDGQVNDGAASGSKFGDSATSGSKCGSTPAQLVDFNALATQVGATLIQAMQLAVDATSVYFVFGSGLIRVPIRGGPASMMLPLLPQGGQNCDPIATPTSVLLHHVVGDGTNEQVLGVPIQGGSATTLATSSGFVRGLATDGHDVYFVDSAGLKSVPMTGGSVQLLADASGWDTSGLAVVGSNLVVTAGSAVLSVPIQGGPPAALGGQQPNAEFPMACGPDTCWWTDAPASALGPTGAGYIGHIARLASGSVTTIPAPVSPWSIAFDGSNFFETVGCDVCSGTLVRMSASGAPAVTMTSASFVAVDDECAYFSVLMGLDLPSKGDGGIPGTGIYSVAKSYADPALAETSVGPGGATVDSGGG
jgi:hypothetical protein